MDYQIGSSEAMDNHKKEFTQVWRRIQDHDNEKKEESMLVPHA